MDVKVVMLNGTTVTLTVNPQDTVGSLKTRIQEKMSVPRHQQSLVVDNGRRSPLSDDSKPLSFYGVHSGSRVTLLVTQRTTIQVFLRNEKGRTSTYHVKPDETVLEFKEMVKCREGVEVSQQRLLYQSKDLENNMRLSDYNVTDMSTIDLMFRLRGG
ncbi:polyubiquitin-like [Nelusetta ayraudi]